MPAPSLPVQSKPTQPSTVTDFKGRRNADSRSVPGCKGWLGCRKLEGKWAESVALPSKEASASYRSPSDR